MNPRIRLRRPASIGSNQASPANSPCSAAALLLSLSMAWSPPALERRSWLVTQAGDYATQISHHTRDGTLKKGLSGLSSSEKPRKNLGFRWTEGVCPGLSGSVHSRPARLPARPLAGSNLHPAHHLTLTDRSMYPPALGSPLPSAMPTRL